MDCLLTIQLTRTVDPLGEYLIHADAEVLDAFVEEVRSHGSIYRADWRPVDRSLSSHPAVARGAVTTDQVRAELHWLFED